MNGITIGNLCDDYSLTRVNATQYGMSYEKYEACKEIEVVPRKMVEMIITRLERNISACAKDSYAKHSLENVKEYTESLLDQFEGDDE